MYSFLRVHQDSLKTNLKKRSHLGQSCGFMTILAEQILILGYYIVGH